MKPQILDLDSEVLAEFRERFNFALSSLIRNLVEKDLPAGEVGGKIRIEINKSVTDDGEVVYMTTIRPDVHLKVNAKAKMDCSTMEGMVLRTTPCGQAVVASNQISMDELIEADRRGA